MKVTITQTLFFASLFFIALVQNNFAQCSLLDNKQDALFITFERMTEIEVADGKTESGMMLRLHNNSTCAVTITTERAEKFFVPLPPKPTIKDFINRQVELDLPDNALVPGVIYSYYSGDTLLSSRGGCARWDFNLQTNRSILFEVPLENFKSKIDVEFQYVWVQENQAKDFNASVKNVVEFRRSELSDEVLDKIDNTKK